jgi:hypothetical protein
MNFTIELDLDDRSLCYVAQTADRRQVAIAQVISELILDGLMAAIYAEAEGAGQAGLDIRSVPLLTSQSLTFPEIERPL